MKMGNGFPNVRSLIAMPTVLSGWMPQDAHSTSPRSAGHLKTGSRMMEVNAIPYFEGLIKHNWARDARPGFSSPTFLGLKESLGLDDMD